MVFGRKRSQQQKKYFKKKYQILIQNILSCFFLTFTIFFAFSPLLFFFFLTFIFVNNAHEPDVFFSIYTGVGGLKKYAIAQQMQMFKKETQRTMGRKQQTEPENSEKEKTNKTTKGSRRKHRSSEIHPWRPRSEPDGGYFKTKARVTVTAAGRLPSGMLYPVLGSRSCFGSGAPETRGASLVGAVL